MSYLLLSSLRTALTHMAHTKSTFKRSMINAKNLGLQEKASSIDSS